MDRNNLTRGRSVCLSCAIVGICAATLECGKLILAALPNIEVVTLFCGLFGYCFGWLGVLSALIFVLIEPMIFGFGTWFITYLIHWPTTALCFMILSKARKRSDGIFAGRIIPTLLALLTVLCFGILSSLVDVGLFTGHFDNFLYRFSIYYLRGIPFYVSQLLTNLVLFPLLFPLLSGKLSYFRKKLLK